MLKDFSVQTNVSEFHQLLNVKQFSCLSLSCVKVDCQMIQTVSVELNVRKRKDLETRRSLIVDVRG